MGHIFKRGNIYWIAYSNGKPEPYYKVIRESTRQNDKDEALRQLKIREGEVADGKPLVAEFSRIKVQDILKDVVVNYQLNGYRSLNMLNLRINKHLGPGLGGFRAQDLTSAYVDMYSVERMKEGAANGTINRELSILKRAYKLAFGCGKVRAIPYIKKLKENNARRGFFEVAEFETLCKYLPDYLEPLIRFLYLTGWRKSEGTQLMWKDISWECNRIYLWTSKNDKGREFPITGEMEVLLKRQRETTNELAPLCPYVFHWRGQKLLTFYKAWRTACRKAGLADRIVHDLRRTAVRNFIRKGIPDSVCMKLTGHTSRKIFDRYDIISKDDIDEACKKMDAWNTALHTQKKG